MILPFVTILAKVFFCSLADRHRAYRSFFVWFLISALVGFGSYAVLPIFIEPQPKNQGLNLVTWILICIITSISTISMGVISCLSDAFAMNSAKKRNSSYGFIRVWGTIGWGVSSLVLAYINVTDKFPLLVPGLIMTSVLLATDVIVAVCWPKDEEFKLDKSASDIDLQDVVLALSQEPVTAQVVEKDRIRPSNVHCASYGTNTIEQFSSTVETNENLAVGTRPEIRQNISDVKLQWLLFKEVAGRRVSLFRYLILFTISGALISVQWSYFFLYLNKIYPSNFTFISSISMVGQSFLGELPFFVISKVVVNSLGRSHTLSLSIVTIGMRYLLYQYLLPNASMYFVLVTEAFQGPNFGLFYVVMTDVGLDYSDCEEAIVNIVERGIIDNDVKQIQKLRLALRATMQSVMSACYEGLGLGVGSIAGGLIIDYYGFDQLWTCASIVAIVFGLVNFVIEVSGVPILVDKKPNVTLKIN